MDAASTSRSLWEYLELVIDTSKTSLENILNKFGGQGWELVTAMRDHYHWQYTVIFKRPKDQDARSPALDEPGKMDDGERG